jgi:hypothetical protein
MRFSAVRSAASLLAVLVLLAACAGARPAAAPQDAVAPTMTIERFLRAVNQNDLDTMANLFGTRDGPIGRRDSRRQVDQHMFLLASVLRHSDYAIGAEQVVPGRREEATMFTVRMVVNNRNVQVPFTLVRDRRSPQWLIEIIGLEQVTRGRP